MPNGYAGSILRVDLSRDIVNVEHPTSAFYRRYFGGRNFIAHCLLNEVGPDVDPLSSGNKLVFATGLITGAPVAGTGRNSVGAKSPLTNGYGEAEAGGFWGPELKLAGFDALIVEGKARTPVYLWIHDGAVEIRDASRFWGLTIAESQNAIHKELGSNAIRTAQIGTGGENLVRYACLVNDVCYAYGRSGIGAVMGSKNLKAVAVRGNDKLEFADCAKLREFIQWMTANLPEGFQDTGTAGSLLSLNERGGLPTHNFQQGQFEGAAQISGEMMRDTILIRRRGCYACPVQCKRVVQINGEYHVSQTYGGPEYEALAAMGSNCGVSDLAAIAKANELCNAHSLDTISTGTVIAFAMECFERGLLTLQDTGGVELRFGNANAMVQTVERIVNREGIGDLLAEGVKRASQRLGNGTEKYAMHTKGQELPMHEPRHNQGMGMGYAVSPTGADHLQSIHDTGYENGPGHLEALGILEGMPSTELNAQKVRMFMYQQHWNSFNSSAGICVFAGFSYSQKAELIRAITGWDTTTWELMKVGERGTTMARAYNVRCGLNAKDDCLPKRFHQAFGNGPLKGVRVDETVLQDAIRSYYLMMGWDEAGTPTPAKLAELDVAWFGDVA